MRTMSHLVSVLSLILTSSAAAATIADFQFDGSSTASTDLGAGWTTSAITTGPGIPLGFNGSSGSPAPPSLQVTYGDLENQTSSSVTLAESISLDNYYSFTVTPNAPFLNFDAISFEFLRTGSAPTQVSVFSSIGGFAESAVIATVESPTLNTFDPFLVDLTGLQTEVPVEFRLYLHRNQASNMNNTIRTDNIQLFGEPFVPEPSSMSFTSIGLVALVRTRRLRRQRKCRSAPRVW